MKPAVLVVGLGRFGTAAALELMALGHEVLALDHDEAWSTTSRPRSPTPLSSTRPTRAPSESVGAGDFEFAIVAISSVTDASIFATMALKNLGVAQVIAKAATKLHGAILERVGADRVIYAGAGDGGARRAFAEHPRRAGVPRPRSGLRDRQGATAGVVGRPVARRAGPRSARDRGRRSAAGQGADGQPAARTSCWRSTTRSPCWGATSNSSASGADDRSAQEEVDARCHGARDDHDDVAHQEQQPRHQVQLDVRAHDRHEPVRVVVVRGEAVAIRGAPAGSSGASAGSAPAGCRQRRRRPGRHRPR